MLGSNLGELLLPARRRFLRDAGLGFGSLALASLLGDAGHAATSAGSSPLTLPHHAPKAKRVIWLFMTGAPSQIDTWDYKPELQARAGQPLPDADKKLGFFETSGTCLASPFKWAQHGSSGTWVSDLFPHLAQHVDDMCFIHSMHLKANNHAPAAMELMCGLNRPGMPSMGAWLDYGLGSANENLPAFVVMHERKPRGDDQIWSAGFLPKSHQALAIDARRKEAIDNLARRAGQSDAAQRAELDLLHALNAEHAAERPSQADLQARLASFELAYRMQSAAPEAIDLTQESKLTHELYGTSDPKCQVFAKQCLTARRLLERGVRFIQIFAGKNAGGDGAVDDVPWDGHVNIETNHRSCGLSTDRPAAALLADLKARGMLNDTLVIWGGEFGRTSDSQGSKGRDHNPQGFTIWMAGGGAKPGFHYGATDPFGYKAIENKVHVNDLHATMLHLLGIDHEKLTYRHNGRAYRLTDVGGRVIHDVIA
ncbi:MAG: DUF1501 domain-containing protein [Planctomycetia bacterium]|nr:DUF1501 domain-containing protein [Planctomycetia bacterium]